LEKEIIFAAKEKFEIVLEAAFITSRTLD